MRRTGLPASHLAAAGFAAAIDCQYRMSTLLALLDRCLMGRFTVAMAHSTRRQINDECAFVCQLHPPSGRGEA